MIWIPGVFSQCWTKNNLVFSWVVGSMAWTTQKYERIRTLRRMAAWVHQEEAASTC